MTTPEPRLRAHLLEAARQDVRRGDLASAARRYKRLTGIDPANPSYLLRLADVSLRRNHLEEALQSLERAAALFARDGVDDKAASLYKRAIEVDPDRADAYEALADVYARLGRTGDAIGTLRGGERHFEEVGHEEEAMRMRGALRRLAPGSVKERVALAQELRRSGDLEQAFEHFVEAAVAVAQRRRPRLLLRLLDPIEELSGAVPDADAQLEHLLLEVAAACEEAPA